LNAELKKHYSTVGGYLTYKDRIEINYKRRDLDMILEVAGALESVH
jgi:hypothetical protein